MLMFTFRYVSFSFECKGTWEISHAEVSGLSGDVLIQFSLHSLLQYIL